MNERIGKLPETTQRPVSNKGVIMAWEGIAIVIIGDSLTWDYGFIVSLVGIVTTIAGCVLWARRKKRHWAFGIWSLLAPIGFLGISLLKDKSMVDTK